jgi:heme exporter protein D
MLSVEVTNVFQVWIAAVCSALFLLALVVVAFWIERRRELRDETRRLEVSDRPERRSQERSEERPKAA